MSTDDEEIAEVARGIRRRSAVHAARGIGRRRHARLSLVRACAIAGWPRHENYRPQIVVQLRPTTPLRPRGMLDEAVRILQADPQADCVRGVTVPKQTPYKMWRDGAGWLPAAADGNRICRALQHAAAKAAGGLLADGARRRDSHHDHHRTSIR